MLDTGRIQYMWSFINELLYITQHIDLREIFVGVWVGIIDMKYFRWKKCMRFIKTVNPSLEKILPENTLTC